MLVEVVVSALLVALVVIGTLTGFDVVNRATADERHHAQAIALAAQSQEQLRSDPASTLSALYYKHYTYWRTLSGTKYEITQSAKPFGSGTGSGCEAGESSKESAPTVQITSTVSWPQQRARRAEPVVQSSVVAPPTGSSLEVDVTNGATPALGSSAISVLVKYTPAEASAANTLEATTNSSGCALFTSIPATKATVEIKEKTGFVTTGGALKYPTKEVSLAPNITIHDPVTYSEGGRIVARFTYKGAAEYEREQVTGDTFVAYNNELSPAPHFQVGSASFGPAANSGDYESGGEEHYRARTGSGYFAVQASTAVGTKYPRGDLFPFAGSRKWEVYAGDCPKNSSEAVTKETEKIKNPTQLVEAGKAVELEVPLSRVALTMKKLNGETDTTVYPVKITDASCEGQAPPNNASAANIVHNQTTSKGHLAFPFQPFGSYRLCLYNERKGNRYEASYSNTTVAGTSLTIDAEEPSQAEEEKREAELAAKRTTEETEKREKRIAKETETREKREAEERAARKKWEAEKIKGRALREKEANQTKERETKESEEASKRKAEESAEATTQREREAAEAKERLARTERESARKYKVESGVC